MPKMKVGAQIHGTALLGNKGITFHVYEDDKHLGWLTVGKATLTWTDDNGKKVDGACSWKDLIAWIKSKS